MKQNNYYTYVYKRPRFEMLSGVWASNKKEASLRAAKEVVSLGYASESALKIVARDIILHREYDIRGSEYNPKRISIKYLKPSYEQEA